MKIYNYDPDTKYFLGESEADPDPVVQHMIDERAKRLAEARANQLAVNDAKARKDVVVLPYPHADDPSAIPVVQPAWLIPAHATEIAPPSTIPAGKVALWIETAWTLVDLPKPPVTNEATGEAISQDFVPEEGASPAQEAAAHEAWAMKLMQQQLDATAMSLGYDDMRTLVGYADEPADPHFQAEGQAARKWRSLFWRAGINLLAAVKAGTTPAPITRAALIAGLPTFTPPPEA